MGLPEWFISRVSPEPNTGCWLWTGSVNRNGYGEFQPGGRGGAHVWAHRVALESRTGQPLGDLCALHRCDQPGCVNPDHLFAGTRGDNNHDARLKGRNARGEKLSRLSNEQAAQIRSEYAAGVKQPELALRFGVGQSAISRIVTGARWKFLGQPPERRGRSLTRSQVEDIRSLCASGVSRNEAARRFGINQSTASRVVSGKRWPTPAP